MRFFFIKEKTTYELSACLVGSGMCIGSSNGSVPTAVAGEILNPSINRGVISDPPPTPVSPTINPTSKPDRV